MEAARTAALAGHDVTLCEKTGKLGGSLIAASIPPCKEKIGHLIEWYIRELDRLGVKVLLNTEATEEMIRYALRAMVMKG